MDSNTKELRLKNIDLTQRVEKIEMTLSNIMTDKEWDKIRVHNPNAIPVVKKEMRSLKETIIDFSLSIPKESKEYVYFNECLRLINNMLAY